jgi:PAS domain S-box-containing protein
MKTDLKQVQELSQKEGEPFFPLLHKAPYGIALIDNEGKFIYINPAFTNITGYTLEDIFSGREWLHKASHFLEYREEIIDSQKKGVVEKCIEKTLSIICKNGEIKAIEVRPTLLDDGRIVMIFFDITERKQTEEKMAALQVQLGQSQKMEAIGRLGVGIAHDFNNILAVIQGCSDLCLFRIPKEDPLREDIQAITNAVKRAANLISQLLAFSRRQAMQMEVIDLNPLVQNLGKMLRRVIGEGVELVTYLADDLGRVKADPGRIEQILLNLAVNARDAMPSGGKLTIETANVTLKETYSHDHVGPTPGHSVMISIKDTGLGMTQEVKERIFEPFFTTKKMGKGTGLGLSMVYGIVKQNGGHIRVDSEPGNGTTFRIYLPRVDEPAIVVEEKEISEPALGSETILLVEDEEKVRKLTARILRKQGYKVLEASQGKDVFSLCEEHEGPIHLMVTDIVMPEMTGMELAEHIKKGYPEMKVLYMSGYSLDSVGIDREKVEKGIEFIQKPFTVYELAKKVREVLDKQFSTA